MKKHISIILAVLLVILYVEYRLPEPVDDVVSNDHFVEFKSELYKSLMDSDTQFSSTMDDITSDIHQLENQIKEMNIKLELQKSNQLALERVRNISVDFCNALIAGDVTAIQDSIEDTLEIDGTLLTLDNGTPIIDISKLSAVQYYYINGYELVNDTVMVSIGMVATSDGHQEEFFVNVGIAQATTRKIKFISIES